MRIDNVIIEESFRSGYTALLVVVEFRMRYKMSLKPMVWNRIISTGKFFDAMYTFVIVTMR